MTPQGGDLEERATPPGAPTLDPAHRAVLLGSKLLRGLTEEDVAQLAALLEERTYAAGDCILAEGQPDRFVYVLVAGRADLVKAPSLGATPSRIGELLAGDTFGEVKVVDRRPSMASVMAATPVTAIAIDLDAFDRQELRAGARATVWRNAGQILAERLRRTSVTGADAVQRELAQSRARVYAGRFLLFVFCMIAVPQLALAAIGSLPGLPSAAGTLLSFSSIVWTVIPVSLALRSSPFPLASYGLTLERAWSTARQAVAWTAPVLVLLWLGKVLAVRFVPSMAGRPVLDPGALIGRAGWGWLLLALLLCALHAVLQELVGRGLLQGTLEHFLRVPATGVSWSAILMADLLFASGQGFHSFWFSVATLVSGVFWGFMFARQRSLVGVSVSHVLVWWWMFVALGLSAAVSRG